MLWKKCLPIIVAFILQPLQSSCQSLNSSSQWVLCPYHSYGTLSLSCLLTLHTPRLQGVGFHLQRRTHRLIQFCWSFLLDTEGNLSVFKLLQVLVDSQPLPCCFLQLWVRFVNQALQVVREICPRLQFPFGMGLELSVERLWRFFGSKSSLHTWWYHPLQLALVVLFHLAQVLHLHRGNLHCVVVVSGIIK